jgi:lactoylglutathione lyase
MKLENIAIWTRDLEALRTFYETYFEARAGQKYRNESKRFESYFLTLPGGGRLELMQRADIVEAPAAAPGTATGQEYFGVAHFGVEVGSERAVDALTARLTEAGHRLLDGPRRTGDGYYESRIADPEGNRILITA